MPETALKRFVHFIYNEYCREFNSEQIPYEGIHYAGIQLERVLHHNQLASPKVGKLASGLPFLAGKKAAKPRFLYWSHRSGRWQVNNNFI
jgi:hypothetical protein